MQVGIRPLLTEVDAASIVVGDFNQAVPRRHAPLDVYAGLQSALRPNLELATAGVIEGVRHQAIDHLAHTRDLEPISVTGLSNIGSNGKPLSDHFGLAVDLARSLPVDQQQRPL